MNSNELNNQQNNSIQTNSVVSNKAITQEVKTDKNKKYWLIPIIVFLIMILSLGIAMLPSILEIIFNIDSLNNGFLTIIRMLMIFITGLCGLGFIPSIIVAIVLTKQNK